MEGTITVLAEDINVAVAFGDVLVTGESLTTAVQVQYYYAHLSEFQGAYEAWLNAGSPIVGSEEFTSLRTDTLDSLIGGIFAS